MDLTIKLKSKNSVNLKYCCSRARWRALPPTLGTRAITLGWKCAVESHWEGHWFVSPLGQMAVCVELACSPSFQVLVLQLPSTLEQIKKQRLWRGSALVPYIKRVICKWFMFCSWFPLFVLSFAHSHMNCRLENSWIINLTTDVNAPVSGCGLSLWPCN